MSCQDYAKWIHQHLDQDLPPLETKKLLSHLKKCSACRQHLHELEKTVLLIQGQSQIKAPDAFADNVMNLLPAENKKQKLNRWLKGHPFLVAAALFLILMGGSVFSFWTEGQNQFSVSAPHMDQLYVDANQGKVIVKDGEVIDGDIIVRNGDIEIRGEVKGDVIVTDGKIYLASTAHIVGQMEEVNQFFGWAWVHIQRWVKGAFPF